MSQSGRTRAQPRKFIAIGVPGGYEDLVQAVFPRGGAEQARLPNDGAVVASAMVQGGAILHLAF